MVKSYYRIAAICISLFIVVVSGTDSLAQWQQLTGLKGEPCYHIRSTSTNLFTGTSSGVLSSNNNGNLWNIEPDLYLTNITDRISTSGDTIVVYAEPDSYLSLDNGASWNEIPAPAGGSVFVTSMVTENGMLYAGTDGDYFYKSDDYGANWVQVISNLTTSTINFTAAEGNTVFLATDDGIFRSLDQGATFNLVSQTVPGSYYFVYSDGTYAFAFGTPGIVKSTTNGTSWIPFNPAILYTDITDFLVDGTTVFAATVDQLMKSDVSSPNWAEVIFTDQVDFCFGLCKLGADIYASTNRGVFSTNNLGASWTEKNEGITPITIDAITYHEGSLFAGASIYGVSSNVSNTWTYSGLPLLNSFDLLSVGNELYGASELGIYKTLDTGATWNIVTPIGSPLPSFCARVAVSDSLILGASIQNGVLRSGDFGANWSIENTGMVSVPVGSLAISGSNIVAGTYSDGLYVSTDAGFNWSPAGASGTYITDLTSIGNNVIAASYGTGTFLSTDNGATWNPSVATSFDDVSTSGFRVIASTPTEIYLSEDSGLTYLSAIPGPAGVIIANSCASDSMLYVSTFADGVWQASISELLGIRDLVSNAPGIKILPNFFSDYAMIVADEQVLNEDHTMIISDASGKTVKKFRVQQIQTRILADEFAPGMYFCSLIRDNQVLRTEKFVVF